MRVRHFALPLLASLPLLSGCAGRAPEVAAAAAPPPAPVVAAPMPRPPLGAAASLSLPSPAADGSITTPNIGLTPAARLWHLRAALNVAALQCGRAGDLAETGYNAFLKAHRAPLAAAHATVAKEYRAAHASDAQDRFDDAMTRVYNFYAQPPVRSGFCAAAAPLVQAAATTDRQALPGFAAEALAALDAPFVAFYRAYAGYRADLAAWQAGQGRGAPRLEVDRAVLLADTGVSMRGTVRYAGR